MSSAVTPRFVLRRTRLITRRPPQRHASTQEAAAKAKESASNVQSKASEGLSRVSSSAGTAISGTASRVSSTISGIGGRAGRLVNFVQSLVPSTIYYSRVGVELSRLVFKGQRMEPPDFTTFQRYFQMIPQALRNPTAAFQGVGFGDANPTTILNRVRNLNRQQWASVGVISAEVLGFFTIGEIIGKRKIIGYRGDAHLNGKSVDEYPAEDDKLRASSLTRRRGGNSPNTLEVLEQLSSADGSRSSSLNLCAVLPSSSSYELEFIKSSFGPNVDLSHCIHREDFSVPASSYIVRSRTTGSRTIINYNELPEMSFEEFTHVARKLGERLTWCHFEGRIPEVTVQCMRYLHQQFPSVKISVEVEKPARAGLKELAREADVVFYSRSWAQANGYHDAERCLRAQAIETPKASLLCCTWGDLGASVLEVASSTYKEFRSSPREGFHVLDTVGAGDTFIAGMLYGLTSHGEGWNISRKVEFANELAGRKVTQEGFSGLGQLVLHAVE